MKKKKYAPENSIVFISDNLDSPAPEHIRGEMVNFNATCVSVCCYPEVDGPTQFYLGNAAEFDGDMNLVFDGIVETPNKTLIISTVEEHVLLRDTVPDSSTRLRIWISHPQWPEKVVVGWG